MEKSFPHLGDFCKGEILPQSQEDQSQLLKTSVYLEETNLMQSQ
jgi:hypothetical protein